MHLYSFFRVPGLRSLFGFEAAEIALFPGNGYSSHPVPVAGLVCTTIFQLPVDRILLLSGNPKILPGIVQGISIDMVNDLPLAGLQTTDQTMQVDGLDPGSVFRLVVNASPYIPVTTRHSSHRPFMGFNERQICLVDLYGRIANKYFH
jgi:hypothetical protein